ncbi:hypothetical protein SAY86_003003 [Trapa natans]|uniref:RecA family profile 1 domain-containing protein n=1 Tax=Trapa natans TaxID=22666 RepID=A0AAN7LL65_TRANT|nr:hypothetical protein SAY86_003003 [Trapa natans]
MVENGVKGWISVNEGAREMLERVLGERPVMMLPPPLHRVPVRAGNVIEISGTSPSAKTLLLIQAAVNCVLPTEWEGVHYGGLGQLVLYIDLDCHFDVARLQQVLRYRIFKARGGRVVDWEQNNAKGGNVELPLIVCDDELLSLCMRRFFYVRCYQTSEFLATLKTLHCRVQREVEAHGARIQLLLIDNIGAFHWVDRATTISVLEVQNRKSFSLQGVWEALVHDLRKLLSVHPMLIVASKASVFGNTTNEAERPFQGRFSMDIADQRSRMKESHKHKFREYMPAIWQAFVTHRVILQNSDESVAASNGQHKQPIHLLEWLLPALNTVDKFVVGDAGAVLVP